MEKTTWNVYFTTNGFYADPKHITVKAVDSDDAKQVAEKRLAKEGYARFTVVGVSN